MVPEARYDCCHSPRTAVASSTTTTAVPCKNAVGPFGYESTYVSHALAYLPAIDYLLVFMSFFSAASRVGYTHVFIYM